MLAMVLSARFPRGRAGEALAALGWMRVALAARRAAGISTGLRFALVAGVGESQHCFGPRPDLRRIALFTTWETGQVPPSLGWIDRYLDRRAELVERWTLRPLSWHGTWKGRDPLGAAPSTSEPAASRATQGPVAVITHGKLPPRVIPRFWRRVPAVAEAATCAPGFVTGFGFGEVPLLGLATFSVWESEESLRSFAWGPGPHLEAQRTTREQGWFTEELFARFQVISGPRRGLRTGQPPRSG
jgi:spheroidene monooxygenase